eukprot:TRINITY_DN24195_c0_g1_i1.p1 TRINITY_DN24195_c0_g1~~TRINITY_DN24195_c0_g1_i1.p1  ORF type:complete len:692 (-),score=144.42 TRINITY_DN24195_c0_g1_i1:265-2340(-)
MSRDGRRSDAREDKAEAHRSHNPFRADGRVTRFAEYIPGVNNVVQRLHAHTDNLEAFERAHRKNPVGANGYITKAAERIPVLNKVIQEVHAARGHDEELQRAQERNPLGSNGILTKAGEHLPLLADGIRCLHKWKGDTDAEERARAHSLEKYLSKDGALVKVAELLPGSNLIASAVLDLRGHHSEAAQALDLLGNWKKFGGADGALAKVAEMLPATDVIAFGLHTAHGHFAHALRSITKTRWVDIRGDSICILLSTESLRLLQITNMQVVNLDLKPMATVLWGGLIDQCIHLLEVDSSGNERVRRRQLRRGDDSQQRSGARSWAKDSLVSSLNETLSNVFEETLPDMVPDLAKMTADSINTTLAQYRKGSLLMKCVLPKVLPSPPPTAFVQEISDGLPKIALRHAQLFPPSALRSKQPSPGRLGVPEVAAAVSGCSLLACLGLGFHTGPLACMAGCFAGLGVLGRKARRQFVPLINSMNAEAYAGAIKPPKQILADRSGGAMASQGRQQENSIPETVTAVLPNEHVLRLASLIKDHVFAKLPVVQFLGGACEGGLAFFLERWLIRCLSEEVDGPPVVPVVVHVEVPAGMFNVVGEQIWLPSFSIAAFLDCELCPGKPYVTQVRLAMIDAHIEQILDVLQIEAGAIDLRTLDPRLDGFAEPINLLAQVKLSWPQASLLRIDIRNLKVHLSLP